MSNFWGQLFMFWGAKIFLEFSKKFCSICTKWLHEMKLRKIYFIFLKLIVNFKKKWKRENLIKKRYLKNQHISEKWVEGIIINQSKLLISQIQRAVIILAKLPTICNNHYCCTMVANGYQYFSVTLVVELNFSIW